MSASSIMNVSRRYPVDVAVLTTTGAKDYSEEELRPFIDSTNRIDNAIRMIFRSPRGSG